MHLKFGALTIFPCGISDLTLLSVFFKFWTVNISVDTSYMPYLEYRLTRLQMTNLCYTWPSLALSAISTLAGSCTSHSPSIQKNDMVAQGTPTINK